MSFAGVSKDNNPEKVVHAAIESLTKINPKLRVSITSGNIGNWAWDTKNLSFLSVPEVKAVSTAGAGDAFLAGIITGITAGMKISEAQELATLVSALSVTSPHTINKKIDSEALIQFINKSSYPVCDAMKMMLGL